MKKASREAKALLFDQEYHKLRHQRYKAVAEIAEAKKRYLPHVVDRLKKEKERELKEASQQFWNRRKMVLESMINEKQMVKEETPEDPTAELLARQELGNYLAAASDQSLKQMAREIEKGRRRLANRFKLSHPWQVDAIRAEMKKRGMEAEATTIEASTGDIYRPWEQDEEYQLYEEAYGLATALSGQAASEYLWELDGDDLRPGKRLVDLDGE